MKKIITAILILVAFTVQAQDTAYNAKISLNMTDSVENGITFQRKAFFEAMIYNQRTNTIALQFAVDFYSTDGTKKMKSAKGYAREVIVSTRNFVVTSTGAWVGTESEMLAAYGVHKNGNVDSPYLKIAGSKFWQLTTPCISEYDWLASKIDASNKLSTIIKNIGQREAAAGKLD